MNVKGMKPKDSFMYLFPEDLINYMVQNTNHYALLKGKENLVLTLKKIKMNECSGLDLIADPRQ